MAERQIRLGLLAGFAEVNKNRQAGLSDRIAVPANSLRLPISNAAEGPVRCPASAQRWTWQREHQKHSSKTFGDLVMVTPRRHGAASTGYCDVPKHMSKTWAGYLQRDMKANMDLEDPASSWRSQIARHRFHSKRK